MHSKPDPISSKRDWLQILDENKDDVRVGLPPAGVPEQKLPAFIRKVIQCLFYPFMRLDLAAQGLLRVLIPPPYKRTGHCKMTGKCCRYLGQDKPKGRDWPFFRWWSFEILTKPSDKKLHQLLGTRNTSIGDDAEPQIDLSVEACGVDTGCRAWTAAWGTFGAKR